MFRFTGETDSAVLPFVAGLIARRRRNSKYVNRRSAKETPSFWAGFLFLQVSR
jgi:hypothetical protein